MYIGCIVNSLLVNIMKIKKDFSALLEKGPSMFLSGKSNKFFFLQQKDFVIKILSKNIPSIMHRQFTKWLSLRDSFWKNTKFSF